MRWWWLLLGLLSASVMASQFNQDYCRYFPGALQTWKNNPNSRVNLARQCVVYDLNSECVKWKLAEITLGGADPTLGFRDQNQSILNQGRCNEQACLFDESPEQTFHADPISLSWSPLFSPQNSGGNTIINEGETLRPTLQQIGEKKGLYWNNVYDGDHFFALEVRGTLILPEGEYWVDSLNISQEGKLQLEGHVVLHVKTTFEAGGQVMNDANSQLTILGYREDLDPFENRRFDFSFRQGKFTGRIYSKGRVVLSNDMTMTGSITANFIQMDSGASFQGEDYCTEPMPVYALELLPKNDHTLLCDRQKLQVRIQSESGELSDFSGKVRFRVDERFENVRWFDAAVAGELLSEENTVTVVAEKGIANVWLESDHLGEVVVTAKLPDSSITTSVEGEYQFSPYGFSLSTPPEEDAIAGKPMPLTITAKRCESNNPNAVEDYHGARTLRFNTQFLQPTTSSERLLLKDRHGAWRQGEVSLNFEQGVAKTEMQYLEAGAMALSVRDMAHQPKVLPDGWLGMQGSTTLAWRPWTLAICGDSLDGTASGGLGLAAAGAPFALSVRPVIWSSTLAASTANPILSNSALCELPITRLFLDSQSPKTQVSVHSEKIHTPEMGQNTPLSGETARFNHQGLDFKALSWPEVGSVWLQSNSQSYFGMNITPSHRPVGRFYPAYFSVMNGKISGENSAFGYLGEPLRPTGVVRAHAVSGKAVKNYHLFSQKAVLSWDLSDETVPDLSTRLRQAQSAQGWRWSKNGKGESVARFQGSICVLRQGDDRRWCDQSIETGRTTTPDGPFLGQWRMQVKQAGLDDVAFLPAQSTFAQLPLRYGRVRLMDASGAFDQSISVPLTVEYWRSGQFVLNEQDNATRVQATENYCKQILWQDEGEQLVSRSTFEGQGVVKQGRLSSLLALPNRTDFYREQVKFWLKLNGKDTNIEDEEQITCVNSQPHAVFYPWLQYNWQNTVDMDPAAVVTFGGVVANPRILYRGERDLHKQTPLSW